MFVCMAYFEVTHLAADTAKRSMFLYTLLPVGQRCSEFDEHELPFHEMRKLSWKSVRLKKVLVQSLVSTLTRPPQSWLCAATLVKRCGFPNVVLFVRN